MEPISDIELKEKRRGKGANCGNFRIRNRGLRRWRWCANTNFERASDTPDEVITIHYDSYRNLVARGVIPDMWRIATPNAFSGPFVPDPR